MKFLDKKDFVQIAKESAFVYRLNYSYAPQTESEMKDWKPHDWVVEAMNEAYIRGLEDAVELRKATTKKEN